MNNTKWDELFSLPDNIHGSFEWRSKNKNSGIISQWAADFVGIYRKVSDWKEIEWLEIKYKGNKKEILEYLKNVHVPGKYDDESAIIYGYHDNSENIDYI